VKRLVWLIVVKMILASVLSGQWYFKMADFFRSPIEYRNPLQMSLFEVKTGLHTFGIGEQPIYFDSTESEFTQYRGFYKRVLNTFDFELFKYNWLIHLLPQNFIDYQTGIGARYAFSLINFALPSAWPQNTPTSSERLYLSPRYYAINLNHTFNFQWSRKFYNYFAFSHGKAWGTTYLTRRHQTYLTQQSDLYTFALGIKMIGSIGYKYKEGYGFEIIYSWGNNGTLKDPHKITPITRLNYNSIGINFTFNSILGGGLTSGDEAKRLYTERDYLASKATFEDFLRNYPKHPRRFKAVWMIRECDKRIPYQEILLAEAQIAVNNYSKAAEHLNRANVTGQATLLARIDENYQKIIAWFGNTMDSLFTINKMDQAEKLLQQVEALNIPGNQDLIRRYQSEIYFHRGVVFVEYQMWEKAIEAFDQAIVYHPPIRERVEHWLMKIASGYISDANQSADKKSIALALESLRQASSIRPDIVKLTAPFIKSLEDGIAYQRQSAAKQQLQAALNQTFNPPPEAPQLRTGLSGAEVQNILGAPQYRNSLTDNAGATFTLWIYVFGDGSEKHLFFENEKLVKIEMTRSIGSATEPAEN